MTDAEIKADNKFWLLYLIIAAEACWIAWLYMPVVP